MGTHRHALARRCHPQHQAGGGDDPVVGAEDGGAKPTVAVHLVSFDVARLVTLLKPAVPLQGTDRGAMVDAGDAPAAYAGTSTSRTSKS